MNSKFFICVLLLINREIECLNWFRQCQRPKTVENFNIDKIIGTWLIYSYSKGTPIDNFKCMKTIYKPTTQPDAIISNSLAWSFYTKWLDYSVIQYNDYENGTGILSTLNKNDRSIDLWNENINYYIISTDYESYLIGYFCSYKYFGMASEHNYYVLTKTPSISDDLKSEIKIVLDRIVPLDFEMTHTDFNNCNNLS
ncbi:unnamed protein product [Brachionus calyciflorus]|uniref:Lipocalin/cytosolic fatty-acid binding domain-containing protein n=1 Tax=Brachionus calyciflorus TaxID=104777 RepID=A0A813V1Z1_9BILA|nr:unnamed protein product [Brachionus calyciflorus]